VKASVEQMVAAVEVKGDTVAGEIDKSHGTVES
jgi:hypothetical protein